MSPADFIAKRKDNKLSERAGAQAHFLDLCELLGVDKPSDPDNYCFERGFPETWPQAKHGIYLSPQVEERLKGEDVVGKYTQAL